MGYSSKGMGNTQCENQNHYICHGANSVRLIVALDNEGLKSR